MIDGHYKSHVDKLWERLAMVLVRLRLTPNQVTLLGLLLVALACVDYVLARDSLRFGLLLAFSLAWDALDGAVARLTDSSTRYGAYLDAMVDRYQEVLVLGALAHVLDAWVLGFLARSASLIIPYAKARAAMEVPSENVGWPDLLERTERVLLIVGALLLDGLAPGRGILRGGLALLALLAHVTALQRFLRARARILGAPPLAD